VHQAVAISSLHLFQSLGSEIGLTLSAVVTQQVLETRLGLILGSGPDASMLGESIRRDLGYFDVLTPGIREKVRLAYEVAVRWSFILSLVLAKGALFAAHFVREKRLT